MKRKGIPEKQKEEIKISGTSLALLYYKQAV
jgi:hypothetical protein